MKKSLGVDVFAGHPGVEEDFPGGRSVAGFNVQHASNELLEEFNVDIFVSATGYLMSSLLRKSLSI